MASAGAAGACGPGATPGPIRGGSVPPSGAPNPRKFSEKIALHTQRQAEETAAFQELMMDLSSTRVQAQKVRLTRSQGLYYGGSLPNVNQIGRNLSELQGSFQSHLESSRSTRHHGLVERVHRDRRFISPSRPYRRQMDSVHLSLPPDPSWRRNWNNNFPPDKSQIFHQLPTTALNRTNSDSALHTSVMNPPAGDSLGGGQAFTLRGKCGMYTYPVPPIEENGPGDGALLKPWDSRKLPLLSSRPKSCEVPGITVFPSPDQQGGVPQAPTVLNTGGSLPDLSSLHFPSPLPTPLDPDEPSYPTLSGGSSTGNLASTLTQLGITTHSAFHSPGLLPSLQGNPSLQSSLSNPNIQLSLSSHSLPSSASLHSSLSNPSLQSSLSSSPSLRSSLSNQSLHSSLSNSSLSGQSFQSAANNQPAYSSAAGGSGSFPPHIPGQSTSPRRRVPVSPVILTSDTRRHHSKQFSPTVSSPLTSITQGVPLDTSKLQVDQRLSQYSFGQPQQAQMGSRAHTLQPTPHTTQLHLHNMQKFHMPPVKQPNQNQKPTSYRPADGAQPNDQEQEPQAQTGVPAEQQVLHGAQNRFDQQNFQQISQTLSTELDLYNDAAFLNSLLDDPWTTIQLTGRQNQNLSQQFSLDSLEPLSGSGSAVKGQQGVLQLLESPEQQLLNQSQCQSYTDTGHAGANLILAGDSPSGLSKEITNALSAVPGFEIDPFSSDDSLRMDPLALEGLGMLTHGDLMLADPVVEESFRSDHLK